MVVALNIQLEPKWFYLSCQPLSPDRALQYSIYLHTTLKLNWTPVTFRQLDKIHTTLCRYEVFLHQRQMMRNVGWEELFNHNRKSIIRMQQKLHFESHGYGLVINVSKSIIIGTYLHCNVDEQWTTSSKNKSHYIGFSLGYPTPTPYICNKQQNKSGVKSEPEIKGRVVGRHTMKAGWFDECYPKGS